MATSVSFRYIFLYQPPLTIAARRTMIAVSEADATIQSMYIIYIAHGTINTIIIIAHTQYSIGIYNIYIIHITYINKIFSCVYVSMCAIRGRIKKSYSENRVGV